MPDPTISATDIIEKVGVTIAAVLGLIYVVRWLSQVHLKALNDRITTLEAVTREKDAMIAQRETKLEEKEKAHMATVVAHAHDMKALVLQLLDNDRANRQFMREHHQVIVGVFERLGSKPCQMEGRGAHPTPRPDLPEAPGSDRHERKP